MVSSTEMGDGGHVGGLEAALQRGVFLHVLAVLAQRGRAGPRPRRRIRRGRRAETVFRHRPPARRKRHRRQQPRRGHQTPQPSARVSPSGTPGITAHDPSSPLLNNLNGVTLGRNRPPTYLLDNLAVAISA